MKKIIVLLGTIFVLLMSGTTGVFADAGGYDFEKANYYVYVATPDGGLNIRSGPGVDYDRVMNGRIPDGVRLYIEYVSGNWGYTSYKDYIGWVALKQTTRTPPATPAPPAPPATQAPIVTEAPQATVATVATEAPTPTAEAGDVEEENDAEQKATKMMLGQISLAAVLIVFIIAVAVVLIVYINSKSRK